MQVGFKFVRRIAQGSLALTGHCTHPASVRLLETRNVGLGSVFPIPRHESCFLPREDVQSFGEIPGLSVGRY